MAKDATSSVSSTAFRCVAASRMAWPASEKPSRACTSTGPRPSDVDSCCTQAIELSTIATSERDSANANEIDCAEIILAAQAFELLKIISRALRVSPAKVAPLVRLVAAQNAELQHQPDAVECWINPGWQDGLTFEPHPDWPVTASALDGGGGLVTVMVARSEQRSRSRVCVYLGSP